MKQISPARTTRFAGLSAGAVLMMACWLTGPARSQSGTPAAAPTPTPPAAVEPNPLITDTPIKVDPAVTPASCPSCGTGLLGNWYGNQGGHGDGAPMIGGDVGCASCGACGHTCAACCVPGRKPCCFTDADSAWKRMCGRFLECICCPDPCYEPRWVAAANNAFFMDQARPVTQMRILYDGQLRRFGPDRSEYFWARINGKGPRIGNGGPVRPVDNHDLILVNEAAIDAFSIEVAVPYRQVAYDEDIGTGAMTHRVDAGFADMSIATKSLFLDCELIQMAFVFRTFIPIGNFGKGLGTGHVSLEPSLVTAIKLTPDCYLQGQIAECAPIGGDSDFAGGVLHYHGSLNKVLCRPIQPVQVIGSLESFGYTFHSGLVTDFANQNDPSLLPPAVTGTAGSTAIYAGAGLRLVFCDKIDFGFGAAYEVTNQVMAEQIYRAEFRWRF